MPGIFIVALLVKEVCTAPNTRRVFHIVELSSGDMFLVVAVFGARVLI